MANWATVSGQLADLQGAVGRIEERLKDLPELEKRVGRLETWRTSIVGAFTGIAAYLTYQAKMHL